MSWSAAVRPRDLLPILVLVMPILLYGCGKSPSAKKQSAQKSAQLTRYIESYLGVAFPESTIQVNAFYNLDSQAMLAFMVKFDKEDLPTFMSARDNWLTGVELEQVEIRDRYIYVDTWFRTVKWWRPKKENLQFAWMAHPESACYRVIWIEKERDGRHKVYIEVHDIRRDLPWEIRYSVFGSKHVWKSGHYPKRAGEGKD